MSLKCPICGKEYNHDRKICQTCEDKSIDSINIPESYTYVHYEQTTAFGHPKADAFSIKIASEPKFSDFRSKEENIWNSNSIIKFRDFFILPNGTSQLKTIKKLPAVDLKIFEKEKNYSLIYE